MKQPRPQASTAQAGASATACHSFLWTSPGRYWPLTKGKPWAKGCGSRALANPAWSLNKSKIPSFQSRVWDTKTEPKHRLP